MKRPKGYVIQPYIHNEIKRSVTLTQEVLFVKTGKVKVNSPSIMIKFLKRVLFLKKVTLYF